MSYNIAIDGPAGAGKSTIAKALAKEMNLVYVDTGAMYRAMGLYLLRAGVDPEDEAAVNEKCQEPDITIKYENGVQVVYLNGENVNAFLRTEEVGNMASKTSPRPVLRARLVQLQQKLAASEDCVMDGRDIGTCVLPGADVKIFMTADSRVRAKRRFDELTARGESCDFNKILADIEERDYRDSHREVSPLKQAEDAVLLDTSELSVEEVVAEMKRICARKRK